MAVSSGMMLSLRLLLHVSFILRDSERPTSVMSLKLLLHVNFIFSDDGRSERKDVVIVIVASSQLHFRWQWTFHQRDVTEIVATCKLHFLWRRPFRTDWCCHGDCCFKSASFYVTVNVPPGVMSLKLLLHVNFIFSDDGRSERNDLFIEIVASCHLHFMWQRTFHQRDVTEIVATCKLHFLWRWPFRTEWCCHWDCCFMSASF